ncbi:MAG: MBOAT family protein [Verrucomicrobiales bacterium]|nr:MBOAT family protein [Verrucomicrobiales bacterium]
MVFSTHIFLFYFLPVVLAIYYALPWVGHVAGLSEEAVSRTRNGWLLIASYGFYGWWNPWYVLLMLWVTLVSHASGLLLTQPGAGPRQRAWVVVAAVGLSLGTLGFFKYFNFLQANLNAVLGWLGAGELRLLEVALPIGISFYVFQALSYSLDVYRGHAPPARSLPDFACYLALFPQLVAGPIVRYRTVADQLVARSHGWEKFASGAALFMLGFSKKVLLANPLGTVADAAFGAQSLGTFDAWFGVTAYAFQIYFDFSGYSDMALGLGRMLGFEFLKNFNAPYHAESLTDFWRRWHISLSTFLRDYLYLPLGGNRRGSRRTYLNLAVVMLLGGLWHGAHWTFVAWGAYHGAWLILERWQGKRSLYARLPHALRVALTFGLVLVSWVFFRSATLPEAGRYLAAMFGGGEATFAGALLAAELYGRETTCLLVLAAGLVAQRQQAHDWAARLTVPKAMALAVVFGVAVLAMFAQSSNPFLYFQF